MISLDQEQPLFTDASYAVVASGDYAPDELVDCFRVNEPEQVVAFYAQFILDGTYP